MSLTAPHKAKPNTQQKKRVAAHHRKSKEYSKAYWPYLPVLMVVIVAIALNMVWLKGGVLDYAVDTSPQGLLSATNQQRTADNLQPLTLNSMLSEAAQSKANDMVTRNYWSHVTPDGQQPWVFITEAGYSYQTAGENLAFGFATSSDTVTGWMNSPGHRANILNTTYSQVGFGIANSADFDAHGHQTVVVAMYASPYGSQQNAAPITPTTTPQPSQPTAPLAPENEPVTQLGDTVAAQGTNQSTAVLAGEQPQPVSRLQLLSGGHAPLAIAIAAVIIFAFGSYYIIKHGRAWKRVIVHGERFVLKHKLLDTLVVAVIAGSLLLMQTAGFIQ